jgi:hypothetical protein
MARPRSGRTAVEHRHRSTASEPPGDAKPDRTGADDDDARFFADRLDY